MFMFNPVTKFRVSLPSFGTFRWRWDNEDEIRRNKFVTKAIVIKVRGDDAALSRGDGLEDLRVVAFYGEDHVAIAKPGSRCWVEIEGPARTRSPLSDVTFDGNLGLIFVDNSGGLFCCNIPEKEESPVLKWLQRPVKSIHDANLHEEYVTTSIVKCGADLLMIKRMVQFDENPGLKEMLRHRGFFFVDSYMTIAFVLYKYDFEKKGWVHCPDLKDVALFVGNNASMWVDAPGGGCIYFTDDLRSIYCKSKYKLGGHDCGVLGFHKGDCVKHLYDGKNKRSAYCCPLFFKPSICVPKGLS